MFMRKTNRAMPKTGCFSLQKCIGLLLISISLLIGIPKLKDISTDKGNSASSFSDIGQKEPHYPTNTVSISGSNGHIIQVPYISQKDILPTGCEIVSALMVLQYYGYTITADEFIDMYLDKREFRQIGGQLFCAHPDQAFIGDPRSPTGYGCYAPVIVNALRRIVPTSTKVINETGRTLEYLLEQYIKEDSPVLVWASIEMRETSPGTTWIIEETGDTFTWIRQEHCMVLVGYDDTQYYFNDPYNGNGLIGYSKNLVEKRYNELGCQAIALCAA